MGWAEDITQSIEGLSAKVDLLIKMQNGAVNADTETDRLYMPEAARFLRLKETTIYGLTCKGKIPYRKFGKVLVFSRKELTRWLEEKSKYPSTPSPVLNEIKKSANRKKL